MTTPPNWHDTYAEKLTSAADAVRRVESGQHVYMGGNAATPRALADALAAHAPELRDVEVAHVLLLGADPFANVRDHTDTLGGRARGRPPCVAAGPPGGARRRRGHDPRRSRGADLGGASRGVAGDAELRRAGGRVAGPEFP